MAKYDDAFNPRAFGDRIKQWGTSTVLIESGALPNDPQKQKLREVNMVAILTALETIATGNYRAANPEAYELRPANAGSAVDIVSTGARLVLPGGPPMLVDIAMNYEDALKRAAQACALSSASPPRLFLHLCVHHSRTQPHRSQSLR